MTVYGTTIPMVRGIAQSSFVTSNLSNKARYRLKIIDWCKAHDNNISLASRHFAIGRSTLDRWMKRLKKYGLMGLEDRSRKPKNIRRPVTTWETVMRIISIRKVHPTWSKYKIKAILKKEGIKVSESTIGRVLKKKGLIDKKISRKRKKAALRPKARFPRGFKVSRPGDMIQIDVKHIRPNASHKLYQFTAIDVLTKRRVLAAYSSESSLNGALFLRKCMNAFPFKIHNIQTDNGSTFQKHFDEMCKMVNIPHYYIYPRSPKQNCYVEASHNADEHEFYQQGNAHPDIFIMRKRLKEWECIWNDERPHASLDYLTPNEYLNKIQNTNISTQNYINLQT